MLDHLLVVLNSPLEDNEFLSWAKIVASRLGAKVTLLHQFSSNTTQGKHHFVDPLEWYMNKLQAETLLTELEESIRTIDLVVETLLVEGSDIRQIVDYAENSRVDLILMPHRDGNIHLLLKSTGIPILSLPVHEMDITLGGEVHPKFLVPLDGSKRAECALPIASYLAQVYGAELILAHVLHKPEMPRRAPLTAHDVELSERLIESNRAEMDNYLNQLAARLPAEVSIQLVTDGNVSTAIQQLAEENQVSLVVLSAHGYGGDPRWTYGKISKNLTDSITQPLLIVQDLPPVQDKLVNRQQITRPSKVY